MNIKSKIINLSAIARLLNVKPTTFYNWVHGIGKHRKLSDQEICDIERLIENELYLNELK